MPQHTCRWVSSATCGTWGSSPVPRSVARGAARRRPRGAGPCPAVRRVCTCRLPVCSAMPPLRNIKTSDCGLVRIQSDHAARFVNPIKLKKEVCAVRVWALGAAVPHSPPPPQVVPYPRARGGGGAGMHWKGREGASEAAPGAVKQAVGGCCRSGWWRLLSVTNAIETGTWRQGVQWLGIGWAPWRGGGGAPLPLPMHPFGGG